MPKLAGLSGRRVVKAFERAGWQVNRQKGSHVILIKEGSVYTLSIPLHDELGVGLLREQIRKSELTTNEFIDLLDD